MTTIILLAPLVGALICGFFWTLLGERLAQIVSTGLLFLAAILSWYVFLPACIQANQMADPVAAVKMDAPPSGSVRGLW